MALAYEEQIKIKMEKIKALKDCPNGLRFHCRKILYE